MQEIPHSYNRILRTILCKVQRIKSTHFNPFIFLLLNSIESGAYISEPKGELKEEYGPKERNCCYINQCVLDGA